jgi:non-homologous end joining protein Ku
VNFFQADPHYFERTWLLIPNNSDKPYALLRKLLEKTGMAAIWKVTMSTKERVVLNPLLPECHRSDPPCGIKTR